MSDNDGREGGREENVLSRIFMTSTVFGRLKSEG